MNPHPCYLEVSIFEDIFKYPDHELKFYNFFFAGSISVFELKFVFFIISDNFSNFL